jgi:hypothetical protein
MLLVVIFGILALVIAVALAIVGFQAKYISVNQQIAFLFSASILVAPGLFSL